MYWFTGTFSGRLVSTVDEFAGIATISANDEDAVGEDGVVTVELPPPPTWKTDSGQRSWNPRWSICQPDRDEPPERKNT